MRRSVIAISALLGLAFAAPAGDKVQALPDAGPLPTPWYSGYLQTTSPSK